MQKLRTILFLISIFFLLNSVFSLTQNSSDYINIKSKIDSLGSLDVIIEIDIDDELREENKILGKDKENKNLLTTQKNQEVITEFIDGINKNLIDMKTGSQFPFVAMTLDSQTLKNLENNEQIKSIKEDVVLKMNPTNTQRAQMGIDHAHEDYGYYGEGQTIAVLDTGIDTDHPMLINSVVEEACYSLNLCPFGFGTTGAGASEACTNATGCDHGSHVSGIALGNGGSTNTIGTAPNATLISINVFSDLGNPEVEARTSDVILGLERVYNLSNQYNISSVTLSLSETLFENECDSHNPAMTTAIENLREVDIAVIISAGNDYNRSAIAFPSCISSAISVGAAYQRPYPRLANFSNANENLDFAAYGIDINSAVLGGLYDTKSGTSMAAPFVSGAFAVLKSMDPTLSVREIKDLLTETGRAYAADDSGNNHNTPYLNLDGAIYHLAIPTFSGGVEILNITIEEKAYERVVYNPLLNGDGTYFDLNENQTLFIINGTIRIANVDSSQSAQNVKINLKGSDNIFNLTHISGREGYIVYDEYDSTQLLIPDLGASQESVFSYVVNTTHIAPPINFTTSYDKDRIFAGDTITMSDTIFNSHDSCIYNVNITQFTLYYNRSGSLLNFTFDNSSLIGLDSSNVSFGADRTMYWNTLNGNCFTSNSSLNLTYDVFTPNGINVSGTYSLINSTISYNLNGSISGLTFTRAVASINLTILLEKYLDTVNNQANGDTYDRWLANTTITNPTPVGVHLKRVTIWTSDRNGTGTGFTDPSRISSALGAFYYTLLERSFHPEQLMLINGSSYQTANSEGRIETGLYSSPIFWTEMSHSIIDNDVQIQNYNISIGESYIYTKDIYIATGYYIEIKRNITRINNETYNIKIDVANRGSSPTPSNQAVIVYNFIPINFNLTSQFIFSNSSWYSTVNASETLFDPIYNGSMHQYALLPANDLNSSLDKFGAGYNINNSWSVEYNITGFGEFSYSDLFLTGVDPLQIEGAGGTTPVQIVSEFKFSFDDSTALVLSTVATFLVIINILL